MHTLLIVLVVVLAVGLGCSSTGSVHAPVSGFLGDLSAMTRIDGAASAEGTVFVSEPGALARYDRFVVEPVLVVLADDAAPGAIDPEGLTALTRSLRQKAVAALRDGGYDVVDAAGPGVLRIRAALTHVDPAQPALNIAGKAAGIASGVGGFVVPAIDVGGAAIEAEFLDGVTGERIAAYRDARRGRRFGGTVDAVRSWGHVHDAFEAWAGELRARLHTLHGRD